MSGLVGATVGAIFGKYGMRSVISSTATGVAIGVGFYGIDKFVVRPRLGLSKD
jgi:hypothetical protein